jgi:hypothetical protein
MRTRQWVMGGLVLVGAAGCTMKVEEKGRAPDLGKGDPGALPKVEMEPANVQISTDTQQVITPSVKVTPVDDDDSTVAPDSAR